MTMDAQNKKPDKSKNVIMTITLGKEVHAELIDYAMKDNRSNSNAIETLLRIALPFVKNSVNFIDKQFDFQTANHLQT